MTAWAGSLVRTRSRGEARVGLRVHPVAIVFGAVFLVALVRNPPMWSPQFVYEEASAYWAMTFVQSPLAFLIDPWVGYLAIVPRAAFLFARLFPAEIAPVVTGLLEAGIVAAVAAFFVSGRFARTLPDPRARIAFGLGLGLLPSFAPYGSILHAHWILAALLIGLALAGERRWYDYPLGVIAVLSGLPAALAAPAFLLRRPDRLAPLVILLAILQAEIAFFAPRHHYDIEVEDLITALGPGGWAVVGLMLMLLASRWVPIRAGLAFAALGVVTLVSGAAATPVLNEGGYDRYFVAGWIAVVFYAVAAGRHLPGQFLGAVVLSAAAATLLHTTPTSNTNWPAHAHCIGGPSPCTVPNIAPHWVTRWTPDYRQPPLGGALAR